MAEGVITKNPVRVGVVGVGYLGRIHARIYAGMSDVELVGVVDTHPGRAKDVAAEFGCAVFHRAETLAEKVEAVSIAVPGSSHLPVARVFLSRGIPALLEKPIAPSVEESAEIVQCARDYGVILQIGHLERFNAGVMKLAEIIDDPRFIEVHRLGKFVERATDVDVVTDLMIHDIDIVLSLVPGSLASVLATGASIITDHVDIANARLQFDNGAVANVTASRVSQNQFRRFRVFAHNRYLGLNFASQQLEEVVAGEKKPGAGFPEMVHRDIKVEPQLPLNAELEHFISCVRSGDKPLVTGEAGLVAVEVAEQVRREIAETMG